MSKTIAIIRNNLTTISTVAAKKEIVEAGHTIAPENWFELDATIKPAKRKKWAEDILKQLEPDDMVVAYDLQCLGLSLSQIVLMLSKFLTNNVVFLLIKENFTLNPKDYMNSPIFTALLDTEEEIKSRQHLKRTESFKKSGKKSGSPKGLKSSKLDQHKKEIKALLKKNYSKSHIASLYQCSWPTVDHFIKTRKLE